MKKFAKKVLQFSGIPTVMDGMGFGVSANPVQIDAIPGKNWSVESGSTLILDVTGSTRSGEALARLVKVRRQILVWTVATAFLGAFTLPALVSGNGVVAAVLALGAMFSAMKLASKVATQEEAKNHLCIVSTDPSSVKNHTEGKGSRLEATAASDLAMALRRLAVHAPALTRDELNRLVSNVNTTLEADLPKPAASTMSSAADEINQSVERVAGSR